jgi:hypothetical protein
MSILTGEGYTQARLAGIMNEMWCEHLGRIPNIGDTIYATGEIVTNSLTQEIGLLIDEDSEYFNLLPSVHQLRLLDVINGDGWNDILCE